MLIFWFNSLVGTRKVQIGQFLDFFRFHNKSIVYFLFRQFEEAAIQYARNDHCGQQSTNDFDIIRYRFIQTMPQYAEMFVFVDHCPNVCDL